MNLLGSSNLLEFESRCSHLEFGNWRNLGWSQEINVNGIHGFVYVAVIIQVRCWCFFSVFFYYYYFFWTTLHATHCTRSFLTNSSNLGKYTFCSEYSFKLLQLDSNPQPLSSQMNTQPFSQWLNGWVFVYELSGCGFKFSCSHLNFRFRACFEQEVPRHSGNYRVWIHPETRTWHDKNIQSVQYWFCFNGSQISLVG